MSKNKTELAIGILLVIMPFLGFPSSWKTVFYILAGLVIIIFAFRSHLHRKSRPVSSNTFTEHDSTIHT